MMFKNSYYRERGRSNEGPEYLILSSLYKLISGNYLDTAFLDETSQLLTQNNDIMKISPLLYEETTIDVFHVSKTLTAIFYIIRSKLKCMNFIHSLH